MINSAVRQPRIQSVDLMRGIVMVLMALDHVRDFWNPGTVMPEDMGQTSPELFFTRWVTHFCAPIFIFLSGSSAWLYATSRNATKYELSKFLFTRGVWLIFIEIFVINAGWFYQPGWSLLSGFILLQVIWVIGCCMVALAALIYLPNMIIAIIGLTMVFGHNLMDGITTEQFGNFGWLWSFLHKPGYVAINADLGFWFAYPLIPWVGVMALGYLFGMVLQKPAEERDRLLLRMGLAAIAGFLVLRGINVYGDPGPWSTQARGGVYTLLSFLNVQKYPPSLLYLLMTLGPAMALLPLLEKARGRLTDIFIVFGRVPFFYYILHLYLIHLTVSIWAYFSFHVTTSPMIWWFSEVPEGYSTSLLRVYLVWGLTSLAIYWPCKWFVGIRRRHKNWWLSYL